MSQRIVELVIGRLITDERFRAEFLENAAHALSILYHQGLELSPVEVAALLDTDPALWSRTADAIDPRLQKASLESDISVSPITKEGASTHVRT